jgi:hypothetical protein
MAQLNLITSNPVTDAYDKRQYLTNQQETQDLQNAAARQTYDFNAQEHPLKVRGLAAITETQERTNQFGKDTYGNDITKSNNDAAKSGVELGKSQEDLRHAQANNPNIERSGAAQATTNESQARVQTNTEGAQISTAQSNSIEAAARAKVAQNKAQYDLEGQWVDLFSKNPQMAIAQAGQYQVPPELVAIAKDQSKAKWLTDAWNGIVARYPNATDAATRAAIFEEMLKAAGDNPSASSAAEIPAGSPKPTTRLDELKGLAQQLKLTPGTQDYVAFIQSDGKALPAQFMTPEETKAAGFPDGAVVTRDGKVAYSPKSGVTVNVNGPKTIMAGDKKALELGAAAVEQAKEILPMFDIARASAQAFPQSGPLGKAALFYERGKAFLGLDNNANAGEVLQAMQTRLGSMLRIPGSGSTSDMEMSLYMQGVPSLLNTQQGNMALADIGKKLMQRRIQNYQKFQEYIAQNGSSVGYEPDDTPLLTPEETAVLSGQPAPSRPTGPKVFKYDKGGNRVPDGPQ